MLKIIRGCLWVAFFYWCQRRRNFFSEKCAERVRFFFGVPLMVQMIQFNLFTSNLPHHEKDSFFDSYPLYVSSARAGAIHPSPSGRRHGQSASLVQPQDNKVPAHSWLSRALAYSLSGSLNASEASQGNFIIKARNGAYMPKHAFFLSGEPLPKSLAPRLEKTPYEEEKARHRLFRCKDNWLEKAAASMIKGVYVAPGFVHQEEQLDFVPLPGKESPISKFNYQIKSNGASLALGCQIRLCIYTGRGMGRTSHQTP